jgi:hypothetical protein
VGLLTELLTNSIGPDETGRDEQVPPSLFSLMISTVLVRRDTEGDGCFQIWRPVLYQLSYTPSDLNLLTFPCPRKELSANIGELSTLFLPKLSPNFQTASLVRHVAPRQSAMRLQPAFRVKRDCKCPS